MLYISVSWAAHRRFCIITLAGRRVKNVLRPPPVIITHSVFSASNREISYHPLAGQ